MGIPTLSRIPTVRWNSYRDLPSLHDVGGLHVRIPEGLAPPICLQRRLPARDDDQRAQHANSKPRRHGRRRRRRRRREERARTAESRVRFLGCRWAKASFLTRKLGTGGPHFLTLRFLNARCQLYEEVLTVLAIARAQPRPARGPAERALEPPEPPHRVIDYSS